MPRYVIREDVVIYGTAYHYVCAQDEDHARKLFREGNADYDETVWGEEDSIGEFEVEEEECVTRCSIENTDDCPDYEEPDEEEPPEGEQCKSCVNRLVTTRECKRGHVQDASMTSNKPDNTPCGDHYERDVDYEDDEDQSHCNKCKWRNENSCNCNHDRHWIQDETMTNNNPDEGWAAKCENYEEGDSEDDEDSDTPVAEDPLAFLD